jgi:hypothetical protein
MSIALFFSCLIIQSFFFFVGVRKLCNFDIGRQIGRGKFGCVHLCHQKCTKHVLKMEVLFEEQLKLGNIDYQTEIDILSKCGSCPQILQYNFIS